MKHIYIFMFFFSLSMNVHAKTITLTIPDDEIRIVENDVPNAEQWLIEAWNGKVANCKSRIIKEEINRSVLSNESIPAGEEAIVNKHFNRPDYKNRKDRDTDGLKLEK